MGNVKRFTTKSLVQIFAQTFIIAGLLYLMCKKEINIGNNSNNIWNGGLMPYTIFKTDDILCDIIHNMLFITKYFRSIKI